MRYLILVLVITCLKHTSTAQNIFIPDTLKASDRALGNKDSLLQFMQGFGAAFFIDPNKEFPTTWALFRPGMFPLSQTNYSQKKLLFSALPHLGFAYGFGGQGSQRLRLDYEQQFSNQTLINMRYDHYKSNGFIRSSELQFSSFDFQIFHSSKRFKLLGDFSNISNYRQWSGGIATWSSLQAGNAQLLPVEKNQVFSEQNAYKGELNGALLLGQDSIKGFRLTTRHYFDSRLRKYNETDSLELFYSQLYLNNDSCRDRFATSILNNELGLGFQSKRANWNSALQIRKMSWQDTQFQYDTTELNLVNGFDISFNNLKIKHQNQLNLLGGSNGYTADILFMLNLPFGKLKALHQMRNAWPMLMQRTYMSNLTNYQQTQPNREQTNLVKFNFLYGKEKLNGTFQLTLMSAKSIYRFSNSTMNWVLEGPQRAFESGLDISYKIKSLRFTATQLYSHWKRDDQFVLPPLRSTLALQFSGGVFKNRALNVLCSAKLSALYGAEVRRINYLPYIGSIDWQVYQNPAIDPVNLILNAQFDLALEVKTFRFFLQACNLLSTLDYTSSLYKAVPFASFQLRFGLTWDFWN